MLALPSWNQSSTTAPTLQDCLGAGVQEKEKIKSRRISAQVFLGVCPLSLSLSLSLFPFLFPCFPLSLPVSLSLSLPFTSQYLKPEGLGNSHRALPSTVLPSEFLDALNSTWRYCRGKKVTFPARLMILWYLVFFPNLPATIYFSNPQIAYSIHPAPVL